MIKKYIANQLKILVTIGSLIVNQSRRVSRRAKLVDYILVFDLILLVGTLFAGIGLYSFATPILFSPEENSETILFTFTGEKILIDRDLNFLFPKIISAEDNLIFTLESGVHYFKIENVVDSEIRSFTTDSQISLRLKKIGENNYAVVNAEEDRLQVDIYEKEIYRETIILRSEGGEL